MSDSILIAHIAQLNTGPIREQVVAITADVERARMLRTLQRQQHQKY